MTPGSVHEVGSLFSFPNPVNLVAARTVAAGVVAMTVVCMATRSDVVLCVIAYGFCARVATGPSLSPLGQLAVRVVAPRITSTPRLVPGPPKRFAQACGAVLSLGALAASLSVGWVAAEWILAALLLAASLEAFVGYCLGCTGFAWLMRAGVVPAHVCAECADVAARRARLDTGPAA